MISSLRLVFGVLVSIGVLLNDSLARELGANPSETELQRVPEATSPNVPPLFPAPPPATIDPFQDSGPDAQPQIPVIPNFELEPWTPEVMEMHEPGVHPLFTIDRVESKNGQLNIYILSSSPDDIAAAIGEGKLTVQLSEREEDGGGTASTPDFRFMEKANCAGTGEVILPYEDELPSGCPGEQISFFFALDLQLGPWRDLAFGYDPYSLWLIR
jgi:hypothetical protein